MTAGGTRRAANQDGNTANDPTRAADYDDTNAYAAARGEWGDTPTLEIDTSGVPHRTRVGGKPSAARGEGTDATIWFNPTVSPVPDSGTKVDARADIVLAHEMAHAYHMTQGTLATGEHHGYGNSKDEGVSNAERQAVGLYYQGRNDNDPKTLTENQYRVERSTLDLGDNLNLRYGYES